ncbi:MAG: LLM class F420-dependent oxidoreductase [Jatrophihabitans sp.]|uniref:LLM class F420-dependent oxidoreductase n=1 Tax=Jatrophihabitans sp. TaxID=1932789 RepID=UPI003F810D42
MSTHIEVSLGLWQDRPPHEVLDTARVADDWGYRAIWIGEMATWDAFALGTSIGQRLTQADLVLGPLAVAVRDPVMIAMGAASVAALTSRGVSVALGASSPIVVDGWHGRDWRSTATSLAESAVAVRALLDGAKASVAGTVVRTDGYRLRLPPPRSELVIAAFGDRAIRVAAAHADRLVLNLIDPDSVRLMVAKLRVAAHELGRPCPRVAVWVATAIEPGPQALEQLRRAVVGYLAIPGYSDVFRRAGFGDVVDFAQGRPHPADILARIPDELVSVTGLVGDAARVERRIKEYAAAGADDIVIVPSATGEDPAGERTLRLAAAIRDSIT